MAHVAPYFVPAGGQCGYRPAGVPASQPAGYPARPNRGHRPSSEPFWDKRGPYCPLGVLVRRTLDRHRHAGLQSRVEKLGHRLPDLSRPGAALSLLSFSMFR